MTSIVTRKFRIYNAQQFIESFSEISTAFEPLTQSPIPTESLNSINYIFIAKSTSWGTPDNPTDASDNIFDTEYQHWREMLSAARVQSSDVSPVIKRYDWVAGTVYREYDDISSTLFDVDYQTTTASLDNEFAQPFYVTTTSGGDKRVYKCLGNNGGTASTIEPTHITAEPLRNTLTDGYIWKFIYSTSSKFETDNFLRVENPQSVSNTVGGIYNIKVSNTAGEANYVFLANQTEIVPGQLENTIEVSIPRGTLTPTEITNLPDSSFIDINSPTRIYRTIVKASGSDPLLIELDESIAIDIDTQHDFIIAPKINIFGDGNRSVDVIASPISQWASNTEVRIVNPEVRGSIFEIDIANIDGATTLGDYGAEFTRATGNSVQNMAADANTVIRPIIGFPQGHGSSPVEELGGNYAMVSKELAGAVVDTSNVPTFTIANEFRKIGLLRDPLGLDNSRITTTTLDQTLRIPINEDTDNLINSLDFRTSDFTLVQNSTNASGKIVDRFNFVDSSGIERFQIRLTEVEGEFSNDLTASMDILNSSDIAVRTGITTEGGGSPISGSLQQFTGEMIYVEHRVAVRRSADQTENVRLIIEF